MGAKLFLASSNRGKLNEYRALSQEFSGAGAVDLQLLPGIESLPKFEENQPTFAENALGKALHYSRLADGLVLADDSGLVAPALGGEPGVHSARYAGPKATNEERIAKLLDEMRRAKERDRSAYFVCAIALAKEGRAAAIVTARVDGEILEGTRGRGGFGYDPVFFFRRLQKTFAEISAAEKNQHSHRGKAFRRLLEAIEEMRRGDEAKS